MEVVIQSSQRIDLQRTLVDPLWSQIRSARCARCNRKLMNPHSIARALGPICYRHVGGGAFDRTIQADTEEWRRRERSLVSGVEIDFGVNWKHRLEDGQVVSLRVSVRWAGDAFEAYGRSPEGREVVFARNAEDLKEIYRAAIAAGPTCTALAGRRPKQMQQVLLAGEEAIRS